MSTPNHRIRLLMELRRNGVTDTRVLGAMEKVPREDFVPPAMRDRAYDDTTLPIGEDQTISQPTIVGLMTQALDLHPRQRVLEIGTGSGYQTAVLAQLCRRVYSIERHKDLLRGAEARFAKLRIHNVTTQHGDGWRGWPEQAPFERIIVTAAPAETPSALLEQLAVGGIMVIPVGAAEQHLLKIIRDDKGYRTSEITAVRFVPLVQGLPEAAAGGRR